MFRLRDDAREALPAGGRDPQPEGYRDIRRSVARSYDPSTYYVDIEIVDVDMTGDRCLRLQHRTTPGHLLDEKDARASLRQLAELWGYEVKLLEIDTQTESVLATHLASPPRAGT